MESLQGRVQGVSAPRSLSDLESRGGGVAGMTLIGSTVRGQLHCLDPLRKLEEKYWRILEKVQIGGEFELVWLRIGDGMVQYRAYWGWSG